MDEIKNDIRVCILSLFRYEEKYLDEWVDYHLNLGFDRIFILDNNDYRNRLTYNNDKVVIIPFNDIDFSEQQDGEEWSTNIQPYAYNYGLSYIKKLKYDYVTVIDNDEFFEFKTTGSIKGFIREEMIAKDRDVCNVVWEMHNDNEIIYERDRKPSVVESFPVSFSLNPNKGKSKCIFKLTNDVEYYDTAHIIKDAPLLFIDTDIAVLHHYRFKTLEEYVTVKCIKNNCCKGETYRTNLVKYYFMMNLISKEKLMAFKEILNNHNRYDYDGVINWLLDNIDGLKEKQKGKRWYNRYINSFYRYMNNPT